MPTLFVIFGWMFAAVMILIVIVPYLRGRSDLLSAWNLFLLGSANFVGIAAIQQQAMSYHWYIFTDGDYLWYVVGGVVAYASAFVGYYFIKWPRRAAGRRFRRWPDASTRTLLIVSIAALVVSLIEFVIPPVPGLAMFLPFLGVDLSTFAVVFCVACFIRQPYNVGLLITTAFAIAIAAWLAVQQFGRQPLLGIVLGIGIFAYWVVFRDRPAWKVVVPLAVVGTVAFVAVGAFTFIRQQNRLAGANAGGALDNLRMLPAAMAQLAGTGEILGGDTADVSLIAIHRYTNGLGPTDPFHTVKFVFANPIPRAMWPDKPETLGVILPREVGQLRYGLVNWGPGLIGHGFYEGGVHMLLFYGLLIGIALRFLDELLIRQTDNPYLLAILASIAPPLLAFSRGDIGNYVVVIIMALLTGTLLCWAARLVFGTTLVYPSDDERAYLLTRQESELAGFHAAAIGC